MEEENLEENNGSNKNKNNKKTEKKEHKNKDKESRVNQARQYIVASLSREIEHEVDGMARQE